MLLLCILAFLSGDVYLQTYDHLPSLLLLMALGLACLVFTLYKRHIIFILPMAFILGLIWSAWYAHSHMQWTLARTEEARVIKVEGYIASIPIIEREQLSFILSTDKGLIHLSWRKNHKRVIVGDRWQLQVKLKRIHGLQSPGAFDYEAWALQKCLRAAGYVIPDGENNLRSHTWYRCPVDHFRQKLLQKFKQYAPASKMSPWLAALIVGERQGVGEDGWCVLRQTGTNHLMAIAGLHIGIMAGFTHFLVMWLWRRQSHFLLYMPAQLAGAIAALMMAVLYSLVAGFSIPTQRACIMLTAFIWASVLRHQVNIWHVWSLAMFAVLMMNPLSVLTESFWLSFMTIALIIYGMSGRLSPQGYWWKWGRVQWVIGLGLVPFSLLFFQQMSVISFIANSIAIPWLGFLILPFCLVSNLLLLIAPKISTIFLFIADKSLSMLWVVLTWFSHLPFAVWHHAMPSLGVFVLSLLGVLLLLLPAGLPGRWLGLICLLPCILYQQPRPQIGDYWLSVLDVGQGLSVVVQTHSHVLVYDAGPKFNANVDMGQSVVLPFLQTQGVSHLDMLVVSHGDNDHIGGAHAILHALPVFDIATSVPAMLPTPHTQLCHSGMAWNWDKVYFSFIYPDSSQIKFDNDSSCVLRIDNGFQRVLLTGDIEKFAENALVAKASQQLPAEILVAPHHGSKTSAIKDFVSIVRPRYVLYATGYRNRYHFPHASVVNAYANIGASQYNTAESGTIGFKLARGRPIEGPRAYRSLYRRYWFD
jgi:competence protein ComEC